MTVDNREVAIQEILKWEGGYSNNPNDPGGPTNWGITLADAQRYWKHDATAVDVKGMPREVAVNIYRTKYWVTQFYDCDKLDSGVDLAVADFGVNSGPQRAKLYLDKSVGDTPSETIRNLCANRLSFLRRLSTWPVFGTGWTRRVNGIQAKALELAGKKSSTERKTTSAVAAGTAATAITLPHLWPYIVGGAALIIIGILLYKYFKKD